MSLNWDLVFKDESAELTEFCKNNDVDKYHSGGGNFHYFYSDKDEKVIWLINHANWDSEDGEYLPTTSNDPVACSAHGDMIDVDDYQKAKVVFEKVFEDATQLSSNIVHRYGGIEINGLTLKEAIGFMKQITDTLVIELNKLSEDK